MKKLFGKKDKSSGSPAPPDDNPYARQPKEDPYANSPSNSYQQPSRPSGLPSGHKAGGGLPSGPRPGGGLPGGPRAGAGYNAPPPPYTNSPQPGGRGGGYGNDRFGASGGYGGNRYDNGGAPYDNKQPGQQSYNPPQRQGGYGGLGPADDDGRGALFNGYQPPKQRQNNQGDNSWESGPDGPAQGGPSAGSYGGYGETRELTEEEQQEMEVQDVKREIINTQKSTIQSGQRSMQMVGAGAESAMNIAQALARQREHLDNAERNIDNASVHNRIAKDQTKRLDKLNGSMFRPTGLSKKKLEALDAEREASEKAEMAARDEARRGAYSGRMRMDGVMQDLQSQRPTQLGASKANRSRREEFKFEDDDGEQEANNQEIDDLTDQISAGVSMLHGAARAINVELEEQLRQVERITGKSEVANDQVKRNHVNLNRAARMN